jgi:hypothetical protein
MLIDEFLCKRDVLGKRAPHSFTPPLSVLGVSNSYSCIRRDSYGTRKNIYIYIEVLMEALDNLEYKTMCTLEELKKLQNKYMFLLQQLYQSNNHEEQEQNI